MNNPVLRVLFSLLLILSVCRAMAQTGNINISGKITASEDGLPVPQASISINRKGVGTSTNAAGLFALMIPPANSVDTLKISCIGFKTQALPISGLKNGGHLNIVLEKSTTTLNEVIITYYDAAKIIQKAISRIPENYINTPHVLRGFYRMYTYSDQAPLQLSEAVFDVYNFGYADKHADLFKLIKARNEKNKRDFSALELGQKPNSIFEEDIINHISACGFLNTEGLKKHRFNVAGVVDIKGYQAYEIDFKENPGLTEGTFRGRMFIDTKTYAFIYFDFGLSPGGLSDLASGNFVTHTLMRAGNVQLDLKQDHAVVSYQEVGNKWVLADVTANNILTIHTPEAKEDLKARIKFNYQVTAVDTAPKATFSSKISRNENINDHESNSDPEFWKDYNILLADNNAEDIFAQIKTINTQKIAGN